MKITALITVLALGCGATSAIECTQATIDAFWKSPERAKVESACADLKGGIDETEIARQYCANPECLAATRAMYKVLPECEGDDVVPSARFEQIVSVCLSVGGPSSTSSNTSTATPAPSPTTAKEATANAASTSSNPSTSTVTPVPSSTTSAASSTGSGARVSAVAVVAAVYTYVRV